MEGEDTTSTKVCGSGFLVDQDSGELIYVARDTHRCLGWNLPDGFAGLSVGDGDDNRSCVLVVPDVDFATFSAKRSLALRNDSLNSSTRARETACAAVDCAS